MALTTTIDNAVLVPVVSRPAKRAKLAGADRLWALAFATPYIAVFFAFVLYPVGYGLWLGSDPASYRQLLADPVFPSAVVNTLIYLLIAVNLKLVLALLLSGLFMRKGLWTKTLLLLFILPWAVPGIPTFISIHWMLNSQWGLINNAIWELFQTDGPPWLDNSTLALSSVIYAHIWKWLPFWTIIFLAGRMAIPRDLYEAAEVDGASRISRFIHITFPLMASLYFVCTLLSTIWALGDFNSVRFVSGRRCRPMYSQPSASATRSSWEIRRSGWPPCSPRCRCCSRWYSC
jgi:multiple sugar transport system permease protein